MFEYFLEEIKSANYTKFLEIILHYNLIRKNISNSLHSGWEDTY